MIQLLIIDNISLMEGTVMKVFSLIEKNCFGFLIKKFRRNFFVKKIKIACKALVIVDREYGKVGRCIFLITIYLFSIFFYLILIYGLINNN